MPTYRRFHPQTHDENGTPLLSRVNIARVMTGNSDRPQVIEAVQWHTGDDTLGLSEHWLNELQEGDYIIIDNPAYPYVYKQAEFEACTELIHIDKHEG